MTIFRLRSSALETQEAGTGGGTAEGKLLSYQEDIRPILDARCTGCHNDGDNPLAPFSLDGEDRARSFRSAIQHSLETGSMPFFMPLL